jgi:hypothetical protein
VSKVSSSATERISAAGVSNQSLVGIDKRHLSIYMRPVRDGEDAANSFQLILLDAHVILSFRHRGLKRLFEADDDRGGKNRRRRSTARDAASSVEGKSRRVLVRLGFRKLAHHLPVREW